jgi:hypothetical protein
LIIEGEQLIIINLSNFIQKVQAYQSSEYALEDLYQQTLKRRDIWDNLEEIDGSKTKDVVLKFLNQWKCRLEYSCASDLAKTLRECSESLSKFKKHSMEQMTIDSLIADSDTIQEVFRRITSVQAGRRTVGATATSKMLHLVNPSFFMMSDQNIRHGYGCFDNEFGYMNFMWRMKVFEDAVIRAYSTARNVPTNSAFASLASECESAATTLPKLLDEYNWVRFNT